LGPEIVALGADKVEEFIEANDGLAAYDFFLRDVLREAPHILGSEAENVLASASLITGNPGAIYNVFSNADMTWPTITLPTGEEVVLNQANYTRYRGEADRALRKRVFDACWGAWKQYETTYG